MQSAPQAGASQSTTEQDPSVMLDSRGARP
jgi:hypothetical protein